MLRRLRQIAREFFHVYRPDPTIQSFTADQQLRQELAKAAPLGMVTTRSQEHSAEDSGLVEPLKTDTPNGQTRKRRVDDEDQRTPSQCAVKRRRVSPEEVVTVAEPILSGGSLKEEITNQRSDEAERFLDPIDISISGSRAIPERLAPHSQPPTARAQISSTVHEGEGNQMNGGPSGNGDSSGSNGVRNQSNTSRKREKTKATHSGASDTALTSPSGPISGEKVDEFKLKKPTHKRFGSEEPSVASDQPFLQDAPIRPLDPPMREADASDESSDSGDDLPETVTAAAGLDQARSAATEEAKAAERQALAKKEKRRKRDAHLKEQAATAEKQRKSKLKGNPRLVDDAKLFRKDLDPNLERHESQAKPRAKTSFKFKGPLPALLPDEILAAEPMIRPPTPPPIVTTITSKKHRFIDADPKPPKDIKTGTVKVRVLEDNKSALPPRASKASKSLKESWLAGERGRKGVTAPRRKIGGGFLRA